MHSSHPTSSNFVGYLENRVRELEDQLARARAETAGHMAADVVRQSMYERQLEAYGQPPKELLRALRTQGSGLRCAWVPLAESSLRSTLVLLPRESVNNPYAEMAVWAEVASHPGRHLAAVVPGQVQSIEHRELPAPLLAYIHIHTPVPHLVVCSSLPIETRAAAIKSLLHLWGEHNPLLARNVRPSDN